MDYTPLIPALHAAAAAYASDLDQATGLHEKDSGTADGGLPLFLMSAAVPTCEITGQSGAFDTSLPPRSPLAGVSSPTRERTSTQPPEPMHPAASTHLAAETLSSSLSASEAAVRRAQLLPLMERLAALLLPSTERLVRLRASLQGLRDGMGSPSLVTSVPSASLLVSPSQPYDLSVASSQRLAGNSDAAAGPPRLCVSGVSDVDVDEVFQFMVHRDSTATRGGSAGFGAGAGGRSGLNSASSALRTPTPDNGWASSSHVSPVAPASQRRSLKDGLVTTGPLLDAAGAGDGSAAVSHSTVSLSDDAAEPVVGFPATPLPPPPSFARVVTEVDKRHANPRLTDSPSPDNFALPTLHYRPEPGIRKAVLLDNRHAGSTAAATGVEAKSSPHHAPSAPHSTNLASLASTASSAMPGAALALRVPAAPSSGSTPPTPTTPTIAPVTTVSEATAHPRSVFPHPPLLAHGLHTDGAGMGTSTLTTPAAPHDSPSPPLPAAPANHNLRSVRRTPSLESRTLFSPPGTALLPSRSDEDGETNEVSNAAYGAAVAMRPPFTQSEHLREAAATALVDDDSGAASFSSTMPDLGDTPPPPPTVVPHAPSAAAMQQRNSGSRSLSLLCPTTPAEVGGAVAFRRRTAHAVESLATPTPAVTVQPRCTASQHSETSEPQRSFLGSSPSPGTSRFSTLPTPYFARVSGAPAASSTGRSIRDDSTILSPGSSFSPAATRLVQRLRRRTFALTPTQLRLTAWDLFHPRHITEQDRALLQATRASLTTTASPERVGRTTKGGLVPKQHHHQRHRRSSSSSDDGGGGPAAGTAADACLHHRRSSPHLSNTAAASSSAPPWMIGISEEGLLRSEVLPAAYAGAPAVQSPPVTTTSDYCLFCVPFKAACCLPPRSSVGDADDGAATADAHPGTTGDAEEVTRALNLLFGPFGGSRQHRRSAAPILVNAENVTTSTSGTGTGVHAPAASSAGGGDNLVPSLTSPLLSTPVSLNHEAVDAFAFPVLGREASCSEPGLRGLVRSWRKTPSPSLEKGASGANGAAAGGGDGAAAAAAARASGLGSQPSRVQRSASPRRGLSSASAGTAAAFLKTITDRLGRSNSGDDGKTTALHRNDSRLCLAHASALEAAQEEEEKWLCPLRQALIERVVFVLVKSDQAFSTPPPTLPLPHSPKAASTSAEETVGVALLSPSSSASATAAVVVQRFVDFAKARYGVTVPSWRVVVFSYRDSVLTRNFLLSYYAYTHGQAMAPADSRPSAEEEKEEEVSATVMAEQDTEEAQNAVLDNTSATSNSRGGERAQPDLHQAVSPPLLLNGSAGQAPQRSAVSPFVKTLVPTPPTTPTTPGATAALSSTSQPGHFHGSLKKYIRSSSRLKLTSSLQVSAEDAVVKQPRSPAAVAAAAAEAAAESEKNEVADMQAVDESTTRVTNLLFEYLTKDINVPPLAASLAAYAPLAPHAGDNVGVSPPLPSTSTFHPQIAAGSRASADEGGAAAANTAAGGSGDDPTANVVHVLASSRALSVSSASEGRQDSDHVTLTAEDQQRSAAACTQALTSTWWESGAATLNSAFRLFEHDAAAHRISHDAFSLMAWSWQLWASLPAIISETQLRCSRLRQSHRHTSHKLEGLKRSIALHESCGPAVSVAAMEVRLQACFANMTQCFARDVRRLLVAPTSAAACVAPSIPGSVSSSAATTFSSSSSASTSRQHATYAPPPLDALHVYETPALREAYRRLAHCVERFRHFYLHGQLPAEMRGEETGQESGDRRHSGQTRSSGKRKGEEAEATATGSKWNTSVYENRYNALRECIDAAAGADACASPPANASSSVRATSMPAIHPLPVMPAAQMRSCGSQSAPPPRLPDLAASATRATVADEVQMPRVDRSVPREHHVSLIASVCSASSALTRNSSSEGHSRLSLSETAAASTLKDVAASLPIQGIHNRDETNINNNNNSSRSDRGTVSVREGGVSDHAPPAPPPPPPPSQLSHAELQQRRLMMEHYLIAQVSCMNTELINFFLATCVAALPHIQCSCVQAEVVRVRTAHAAMYSAFTTAVYSRRDAAMAMAQMYSNLEQWTAQVGSLLSMVHSRRYLEKFIVQLRAVLCEDQIRGLAAYRNERHGKERGPAVRLTNVNLARHRTAIATTTTEERRSSQKDRQTTMTVSAAAAGADAAAAPSNEVGVRAARLLLYYTRLACKPAHQQDSVSHEGGGDNASFVPPSLRPTSATSTATSQASISRRRRDLCSSANKKRACNLNADLDDTVLLTSMSAAWSREENASRNVGDVGRSRMHRSQAGEAERANGTACSSSFYAASAPPCMAAVSASLITALGGGRTVAVVPSSTPWPSQRSRPSLNASEESVLLTTSAAASPRAAWHSSGEEAKPHSHRSISSSSSTGESNEWPTRLARWRARLSQAERPADIGGAPLLWLLLDTWDETLLRFPYGLLLQLDTARYAESLNALCTPVMASQRGYEAKLTEAAQSATKQLAALEEDMKRLQGDDGEVRADYAAALRSIFEDAAALVKPPDAAEHASFFAT